jgi:PAS domain S-box-containing protein
MHGTEPDEWAGRPLLDMFAEESKPMLPELARRAHEAGHLTYESIHVRADGSTFPVLTEVTAYKDEKGEVLFRAANFIDITERKRAERELELERLKLQRLLEGAPFAVVVYEGPEHVVRYSNPKHDEMTGERVAVGKPLVECLPELAGHDVVRILDEVYETGQTRNVREYQIPLMRGGRLKDRWFDVTWQAMHDASGRVSAVLVSAIEVTEHVLARKRLEEAHRVTEAITSNATLGLLMMDARQHCTFMNPAAERITGFRLEEVQGKPLHYFVHHSHPDGTPYPMEECPIDRALPTKNQERGEDVFVHKDGRFYPVAFTASPLLEGGKPVGTVIEVRDTTEERAAQRERERILADLRAAVAARDEFLSIASHELKTPLTPLQLQLDALRRLLGEAGARDGRLAGKIEQAARQTARLSRLVESLLDVSRITGGQLPLEREEIDFAELVSEVAERFREEARRAGCSLAVDVEAPVVGRWDRLRLEQVVANLISNAIKYGAGKPVEVHLAAGEGAARLTVRDYGLGVAEEDKKRIFERFERAVSMRHYGGLGLGLYIARQIIEAHGGSIAVSSERGAGSTFTITLPLERAAAAREPRPPQPGGGRR